MHSLAPDTNKLLVRRFVADAWNSGPLELLDELIRPAYDVPGVGQGPAAVKRNIASFRSAFPNLVCMIEVLVAEGDRVAVRLQ